MFIGALLVFASTLLVKQHLFVDVFGGIAVVEIGLFLSGKFNLSKVFYSLESKLKHEGK
jgi:membrane-associated phospholipid phosphatase